MGSASSPRRPPAGRLGALRASARGASVPARVASALLAGEALVLLALGVLQVLRGFGPGIDSVGRAEAGGVVAVLGGLAVAVLAVGVLRRVASFRSPALVVQILCLPVAWGLVQSGYLAYGVPLLAVPLMIIVALALAGGFGAMNGPASGGVAPRSRELPPPGGEGRRQR